MKTIGYKDLIENKTIRMFNKNEQGLFRQTRIERIQEALTDLKHMGNIAVYLIDGKKARFLFNHSI